MNTATARINTDTVIIPSDFICPITMELMVNPVMTRYGHCFDRSAIVTWICSNDRVEGECPLTRNPLRISDIINNYALAERIQVWCTENSYPLKRHRIGQLTDFEDSTLSSSDGEYNEVNHFFVTTSLSNLKRSKVRNEGGTVRALGRSRRSELQRSTSLSTLQPNASRDGVTTGQGQRGKVAFIRKAFSWTQRP
jgi:hypothetical protein